MPQLISWLLKPLADLITSEKPTTLQQLVVALDSVLTWLAVALSIYGLALNGLTIAPILDRITEGRNLPGITDESLLLTTLCFVVLVKLLGGPSLMKLKFLIEPLLEEIRETSRVAGIEEGREEGHAAGQRVQAALTQTWLEEQERAGRITIHEDLKVPVFDTSKEEKPD